jgi:hypothetical protein
MLRAVLIILLAIEGGVTLLKTTTLVYTIAAYDPVTIVIIASRALVAAGLITSAWLLANDALPARAIARAAVVASAVLYIFDAGLALAPSIAPVFFRTEFLIAYWLYALIAVWRLRSAEG